MFNLGMGEITVILLLALIFLGPKKLPELASGLGKIIKDIRKATADVKNEIQLDEHIRKPFEELRDAVMLPPEELKRRDLLKKELEEARRKAEADLAALSAATESVATTDAIGHASNADGHADINTNAHMNAGASLPLPGMPSAVPPPFPGAGSGPHTAHPVPPPFPGASSGPHTASPVPPPLASSGSGPHGVGAAHPPLRHATPAPHTTGAPHVAAIPAHPPHTVPVASTRDRPSVKSMPVATGRPVRLPGAAAAPVPPPTKPHGEKTVTTQFLSEADLIPPDAPPPLPPPIPGGTGKHAHPPAVPGVHGNAAEPAASEPAAVKSAGEGDAPAGASSHAPDDTDSATSANKKGDLG